MTKPIMNLDEAQFDDVEACEYPDSQKVLIAADQDGRKRLRKIIRAESTVDYYDREPTVTTANPRA